jgi:pimeloyl-ACP methyl ester carboxylesterase
LLHGCEYRSLTLIDPVAIAPWGSPFVRHVRDHEAAFAGLPPYIHAAVLRSYIAGAAFRPLAEEVLQLYVEPWVSVSGQAAFYTQIAQMDQRYTDEIEPRYAQIRCPVKILWGEQDTWIPIERGSELVSRVPGATLRKVRGAGHLVQEDAPEAIVAAVLGDLTTLN